MTVEEINAIKNAVVEVIAVVFILGISTFFGLACLGCFDKE